jgi:hypothetical protein
MKRVLFAMTLVMVSSAAFAEAGQPTAKDGKCWALTDSRGFGYWDHCAGWEEAQRASRPVGINGRFARARTQMELYDFGGAGGAGGDGGGGGGNGR